jgi:hypothetical protein
LLQIFKVHESTSIHKKHYSESSSLHTEATKQLCELISWASKERKKRWQLTGDGETSKEDGVLTGEKLLGDSSSGGRVSDGKLRTAIKLDGGACSLESGDSSSAWGRQHSMAPTLEAEGGGGGRAPATVAKLWLATRTCAGQTA